MRRVARREADEVRRVLARRVRSGARRDNLELLDEQRESRRAALSTFQKRPLFRRIQSAITEVSGDEHGQLELVVDHVIVLPHALEIAEHSAGAREERVCLTRAGAHDERTRGIDQSDVFCRSLADRLSAERFLVAHLTIGRELSQHAADDVLHHRRRPDRLHHERAHHLIAAEIRREVW